jgi:FkbM family methyltransferase
MEGTSPGPYPAPLLDASCIHVSEGVEVRPGVGFSVVTGAEAADPISLSLREGRFPDSYLPLVELLETLAPAGGRVLDLGTHVGTFLLMAATLGYEVLGVEASPRNASLLQSSIDRNKFDRARLVHAAVSDAPGQLMFLQGGPYGHVVGSGSTANGASHAVEVPALAIDDLLDSLGWDKVDFIKMDIEGSEVAGLRGLSRRLSRSDAPPLIVESNGHTLALFGQTTKRLRRVLEDFGYRIRLVEPICPREVRSGEPQTETCVDYLALKRDPRMGETELSRRILKTSVSKSVHDRLHITRELAAAGRKIRAIPAAQRAIEQLRSDPEPAVREAAEAAAALDVQPAWKSWLGLRV